MDILITLNIKLYEDRPQEPKSPQKNQREKAPRISHEFYYWNIIVLSQLLGNAEVTELISKDAPSKPTRPSTSRTPCVPRPA